MAMAQAAEEPEASRKASDAPVVMFSPACASFDQWRNFEARGDAFRALVHKRAGIDVNLADGPAPGPGSKETTP